MQSYEFTQGRAELIRGRSARWNTIPTYHTYKLTWPKYNPKGTKAFLQCNRVDISTLINALTGHCLMGNARKLGLTAQDYCSCKQMYEEKSIEHLLCFCPAQPLATTRFRTSLPHRT